MVIDVTDATFEAEVLQRSMSTPVVVDLWAPWCGPCKTLTPILEKVINETGGQVVLAKVNVDENPQVSQAFQVQSIPAVYALSQGQVVSNFMGAQPEAQIRAFVAELGGGVSNDELASLLATGDEASLRKAVELAPDSKQAVLMLAQLLAREERFGDAVEVLSAAPEGDQDIEGMLAAVRAAALPPDAQNQIGSRLEALLPNVKADDDARTEFLSLLEELATGDPEGAATWRKRLSTQLF
ncbi:MAG: thioredoxin [Actinomycetota bacterium]